MKLTYYQAGEQRGPLRPITRRTALSRIRFGYDVEVFVDLVHGKGVIVRADWTDSGAHIEVAGAPGFPMAVRGTSKCNAACIIFIAEALAAKLAGERT
jgi:hypothetical protein